MRKKGQTRVSSLAEAKGRKEALEAARDFMVEFELVFREDWDYTRCNLQNEAIGDVIAEDGTLLDPGMNLGPWEHLCTLLQSYRLLKEKLAGIGMYLDWAKYHEWKGSGQQ